MTCHECARDLSPDSFYESNRSRCRECVKEAAAARRRANPTAHREYAARWREREQQRADLLEHVLRVMAVRFPEAFHAAVMDAEDSLGLEPGSTLELFNRRTHVSPSKDEKPTTDARRHDAA